MKQLNGPIAYVGFRTVKTSYEPGMKVTYDPTSQRVVVAFRGKITVLPSTYETEAQGMAAGEFHCRCQGWMPRQPGSPQPLVRSMF